MNGEKAKMVFTDPPWNVGYSGTSKPTLSHTRNIINDKMSDDNFCNFISLAIKSMSTVSELGAMTYVVMPMSICGLMMRAMEEATYHWSSTIIWAKDQFVISRKDYHTQYEPIWYGWLDGAPRICPLEDRKQSDLWQIDRPKVSHEHPMMKPVELVVRAIKNSSHNGDIILDLFGGSGTTMIAAENTGRTSRMAELDPKYVDVIVRRYLQVTGKQDVTLLRDGKEILYAKIAGEFAHE
jgi:DNA modification methylase